MGPKSRWGGVGLLSQTRPIPRSPDGDKNIRLEESLSYSSIVPRRENNIKGAHWLWTSNLLPNEIEKLPLMVSQWPPVLPTWSNFVKFDFQKKHLDPAENSALHSGSSIKYAHRGWLCIAQGVVIHKIPTQLRTSENSWEHRKTTENIRKHLKSSDIILRTTEDPS